MLRTHLPSGNNVVHLNPSEVPIAAGSNGERIGLTVEHRFKRLCGIVQAGLTFSEIVTRGTSRAT
ncbi:hypothetical protein SAMN05444166_3280 [Singulisphaera sp. GP187]|nr:hypothetical protein SAMN05444166_3280 [Singulisphaera sp. GP187]